MPIVKETRAVIMRAERVADVDVCMVNVVMASGDQVGRKREKNTGRL